MDEKLLKDFKSRMRIFHAADDDNLENILESSKVAVKRWCGTDNVSNPEIRELVIERSRYVYNDSLEFFNDNFQSELMAVSLANYEEGVDGKDEVPETQSQ
ncbi:head-tail connector protein [Enterococcus malodoratus]|uniref:head-tail connector protein n=1 Tax=Enterococcus malodoratus TaxID=71451 RepID=UPI0022E436C8|nr:head-tail connector protein [Enterococcus malodoratus]